MTEYLSRFIVCAVCDRRNKTTPATLTVEDSASGKIEQMCNACAEATMKESKNDL